jgi:hypothetical protein
MSELMPQNPEATLSSPHLLSATPEEHFTHLTPIVLGLLQLYTTTLSTPVWHFQWRLGFWLLFSAFHCFFFD